MEQIVDVPVPQTVEEIVSVPKISPSGDCERAKDHPEREGHETHGCAGLRHTMAMPMSQSLGSKANGLHSTRTRPTAASQSWLDHSARRS
eukprot:4441252-Amphidinium_carterae.1